MKYVDGFVLAVPADKQGSYRKHAAEAAPLFKEFGASRVVECWGDDVPDGKLTDFRAQCRPRTTRSWCSAGSSIRPRKFATPPTRR